VELLWRLVQAERRADQASAGPLAELNDLE
jgi:hypothetical protein